MGPTPKFNFVPEKQLLREGDPTYYVNIYANKRKDKKTGEIGIHNIIIFSKEVVNVYDLDQKFIRLYADKEKKTIGWSILEGGNLEELEGLRQVKKCPTNGVIKVSIDRLLKGIDVKINENRKQLLVKTYKSPLHSKDIYYINL